MALTEALAAGKLKVLLAGVLVVGAGGGATYVAAGGQFPAGLENPLADAPGMLDTVPEDVDVVVQSQTGFYQDPTTEQLVNGFIDISKENSPSYSGPDDYEEWLEDAQESSDLEVEKLDSLTIYATYPEQTESGAGGLGVTGTRDAYVGVLIDSEWAAADFIDAGENDTEYEQEEYEGYTVYNESVEFGSSTWIGVLDDGKYVLGSEEAVKDAIDVDRGDEEPFDNDVRAAFENTRDGYLRFAAAVPQDRIPEDIGAGDTSSTPVDYSEFRNVEMLSGAYFTNNEDTIGMEMRLTAGDSEAAADIADVVDGGVSFVRGSTNVEAAKTLLENVEIEQNEDTVTITFESEVEQIIETFESLAESQMGTGTGGASSLTATG
jgi:hypothetical protein